MKSSQIFLPIICLAAGVAIGYYVKNTSAHKLQKKYQDSLVMEDSVNSISFAVPPANFEKDHHLAADSGSRPIDTALAHQLISAFQTQQKKTWFRKLRTPDGSLLKGFYINRGPLDSILANKSFTGVSIYFAKSPEDPGGNKRIYTLIYAGASLNKLKVAAADGVTVPAYSNSGQVYEYVYPCPDHCSTLDANVTN